MDAVKYANENSVSAAAKRYKVDRKSIRQWRNKKDAIDESK